MKYIKCVKLFEIRPDGSRRIMNTVDGTSRFRSIRPVKDQHTEEGMLQIVRELKQGWETNGPRGKKYEIVRVYTDWTEEVSA